MSTFTDQNLASGWTQATLTTAVINAFASAGITTVTDNYNASGTQNIVFYDSWGASTYSNVYIRITISSTFSVQQTIYTSWNTTNKSGNNASSGNTAITYATGTAIQFKCINSGVDGKLIVIYQVGTSSYQILGYIRPSVLNNISEGSYCTALQFNTFSSKALLGTTANPFGTTAYNIWDISQLQGANHFGARDVFEGVQIFHATKGCLGKSPSFSIGAFNGLSMFEPVGTKIVLIPGNSGLAVA